MRILKRLLNVTIFLAVWLGFPYWMDHMWLAWLTWFPGGLIVMYLDDELD